MKITNILLTSFVRRDKTDFAKADGWESWGSGFSSLFNVLFGKVVCYEKGIFKNPDYLLMHKILSIVFIIICPHLGIPFIFLGLISLHLSKTHKDLYSLYAKNVFSEQQSVVEAK